MEWLRLRARWVDRPNVDGIVNSLQIQQIPAVFIGHDLSMFPDTGHRERTILQDHKLDHCAGNWNAVVGPEVPLDCHISRRGEDRTASAGDREQERRSWAVFHGR